MFTFPDFYPVENFLYSGFFQEGHLPSIVLNIYRYFSTVVFLLSSTISGNFLKRNSLFSGGLSKTIDLHQKHLMKKLTFHRIFISNSLNNGSEGGVRDQDPFHWRFNRNPQLWSEKTLLRVRVHFSSLGLEN